MIIGSPVLVFFVGAWSPRRSFFNSRLLGKIWRLKKEGPNERKATAIAILPPTTPQGKISDPSGEVQILSARNIIAQITIESRDYYTRNLRVIDLP